MFPLPLSAITLIAGIVFGASVSWYVASNIATRKERDALQKIQDARDDERKRNDQIATKHASDLFQVLDHYRRNPVTVRLPQLPPTPGGACPSDVPAKDLLLTVGGVKPSVSTTTP